MHAIRDVVSLIAHSHGTGERLAQAIGFEIQTIVIRQHHMSGFSNTGYIRDQRDSSHQVN